jgi:hypothetical protein
LAGTRRRGSSAIGLDDAEASRRHFGRKTKLFADAAREATRFSDSSRNKSGFRTTTVRRAEVVASSPGTMRPVPWHGARGGPNGSLMYERHYVHGTLREN